MVANIESKLPLMVSFVQRGPGMFKKPKTLQTDYSAVHKKWSV